MPPSARRLAGVAEVLGIDPSGMPIGQLRAIVMREFTRRSGRPQRSSGAPDLPSERRAARSFAEAAEAEERAFSEFADTLGIPAEERVPRETEVERLSRSRPATTPKIDPARAMSASDEALHELWHPIVAPDVDDVG